VAAAKKRSTGPTPVEATVHRDKRTNIPTADNQEFVGPEVEAAVKLRWDRDPSLDPQLVWKGKDADADELVADAPPIFIQEKIDPRVLVENLRSTAKRAEMEPELTLFESFDGLSSLDQVEFYRHDANWSNRMILGDSLQVMGSLAEREGLRGKVQMIYIDPPYGIKFGSNWQVSTRKRDVKDGKYEDATFEVEQIKAFRDTWELGIHSYLTYLRDRLMVARDLLTESGSVFVQIGDENVHLVRALMDEVFGSENFRSQIAYRTSVGLGSVGLDSVANYILWFSKTEAPKVRPIFTQTRPGEAGASRYTRVELRDGSVRRATDDELADPSSLPAGAHLFRDQGLTSRTGSATTMFSVEFQGRKYSPTTGGWRTGQAGMVKVIHADRLLATGNTLSFKKFYDDFTAVSVTNFWDDVSGGITSRLDPKIYVVQTSTRIIERCMLMCTDPGDLVLDPTCGSGTTSYVAEQWGRRWITCDTSRVALALARQRLMASKFPYYLLADSPEGRTKEQKLTGTPLAINDSRGDIRLGFVYERVQHITLKSIANNPDIREGMSRDKIDAAIKRHADFEMLYDKPYEDKGKVRVSGPFTVESLSPHRSIAFTGQAPEAAAARSESTAVEQSDSDFEAMILDNLRKAGIQNGRRNERLEFTSIDDYQGMFVHAVGEQKVAEGDGRRIGIVVGPQYGTVGPRTIMDAAREAVKTHKTEQPIDLLAVLAFAFDPQALGSAAADGVSYEASDSGFADVQAERKLGKLPVLLVRMNNDLVMGDDLKKTGKGNLFTVFGEPDIDVKVKGDKVIVAVKGVDVYDPSTGIVRSQQTDQIALWMIDTNYNDESFFVRHCYFTGGNDPYQRLKRALKAEIDEDAWNTLCETTSRPFAKPDTGKIAVKVINNYGDEVLKVFEV